MMLLVSLLSAILLVAADDSKPQDDIGVYGKYNTWRQTMCEKNDQDLLKEINECFKKENPKCRETVVECMTNADPSSEGDSIAFTNTACQDVSLYLKFDECLEEKERDEEVSKDLDLTREDFECYSAVLAKYGMDDLQDYLKRELED